MKNTEKLIGFLQLRIDNVQDDLNGLKKNYQNKILSGGTNSLLTVECFGGGGGGSRAIITNNTEEHLDIPNNDPISYPDDDFLYPDRFYNFSDGVNVTNAEINKWIKEIVEKLKKQAKKRKNPHITIASGNTKVIGIAYYDKKTKLHTIDITVTKNYKSLDVDINLKKMKFK